MSDHQQQCTKEASGSQGLFQFIQEVIQSHIGRIKPTFPPLSLDRV